MTDLRQRTSEILAFESNPSRDEWRKLVEELLQDALRYRWLREDGFSYIRISALTTDTSDVGMDAAIDAALSGKGHGEL